MNDNKNQKAKDTETGSAQPAELPDDTDFVAGADFGAAITDKQLQALAPAGFRLFCAADDGDGLRSDGVARLKQRGYTEAVGIPSPFPGTKVMKISLERHAAQQAAQRKKSDMQVRSALVPDRVGDTHGGLVPQDGHGRSNRR